MEEEEGVSPELTTCPPEMAKCLLCPSPLSKAAFHKDTIMGNSLRFRTVCGALRISFFAEDQPKLLLFCQNCTILVDRLVEIEQQVQALEDEYKEAVRKIRETALAKDVSTKDEMANIFQKLLLGNAQKRSRGRPRKYSKESDDNEEYSVPRTQQKRESFESIMQKNFEKIVSNSASMIIRRQNRSDVEEESFDQLIKKEIDSENEEEDNTPSFTQLLIITPDIINEKEGEQETILGLKNEDEDNAGDDGYSDATFSPSSFAEEVEPNRKKKERAKRASLDTKVKKTIPEETGFFKCPECSEPFKTKTSLWHHLISSHGKSNGNECDICGKPFIHKTAMRRHRWTHYNEEEKKEREEERPRSVQSGPVECSVCKKIYGGPRLLRQHEKTHDSIELRRMKNLCNVCNKGFSDPVTLKHHIKVTHNRDQLKWFQCPQCPKKFHRKLRLKQHMPVHTGEKPHICDQCGLRFLSPQQLKTHMLRHQNLRPYPCTFCDMAFFRQIHANRHMRIYHLNPDPPKRFTPYRAPVGSGNKKRKKPCNELISSTI